MASRRLQVVLDLDTGGYSGRLAAASGQMKNFSGVARSASGSVSNLGGAFNRFGQELHAPARALRDNVLLLGNLRLAFLSISSVIGVVAGGFINQSREVERLTVLMKGMSSATTEFGKNQEAAKNLRQLYDLSRNSGFAMKEVTDAFVKFKSAGINPMNGSLTSLTNAVAQFGGTSETMHRASIAIQQMAGKGKVSMEELRQQLGEAVPTAMSDMARAMGMTMAELNDQVKKGKVIAGPALEAMFREFEIKYSGAGKRMAQTLNGQLSEFKTNLMELSTFFTGLNVEDASGSAGGQMQGQAGVYSTAKNAMIELNKAMQSPEAKAAMIELGQSVNAIAQGLISTVKVAMEWRDEIGFAVRAITVAFVGMKALQVAEWFIRLGQAGVASLMRVGSYTNSAGRAITNFSNSLNQSAAAYRRVESIQALRIDRLRSEVTASAALISSNRNEVLSLQAKRDAITHNMNLLTQQRARDLERLRTAQLLHAANLAEGRSGVASAAAVNAAQSSLNQTTKGILASRQRLSGINQAIIAGETAIAAATNANTRARVSLAAAEAASARQQINGATIRAAAVNAWASLRNSITSTTTALVSSVRSFNLSSLAVRANAAAAGIASSAQGVLATRISFSTTAARASAAAMSMAAAATRAFGVAVNLALGPLGLIAGALLYAASQAGVFETSFDRASAAADRLSQKIGTLNDLKIAQARIDELDRQEKEARNGGAGLGFAAGLGGFVGLGGVLNSDKLNKGRLDGIVKERNQLRSQIARGAFSAQSSAGRDRAQLYLDEREKFRSRNSFEYNQKLEAVKSDKTLTDKERAKKEKALSDKYQTLFDAYDNTLLSKVNTSANALKGKNVDKDQVSAFFNTVKEAIAPTQKLGEAAEGMGDSVGGAGDKAGKASKKLTEAQKEAKKAATELQNAREKYDNMIGNQAGQIAEMREELTDGTGALEKFQAKLKAGMFPGITEDQIAALTAGFKEIDALTESIATKRSMESLVKDLAQANQEAKGLWESLNAGNWERDLRFNQIKSQFADRLEGITDPEKLAKVEGMISRIAYAMNQADAAQQGFEWQQQTDDINFSLSTAMMTEEQLREAQLEREIDRQRRLVDWTRLTVDQRTQLEGRFNNYVSAMRARTARENESALVQMSRSWMRLGANMHAALGGALDGFVNSLENGKLAFGDFAKTIIKELIKVILKAMIAYAILSAIGMTEGMSFGGFMKQGLADFAGGFTSGGNKSSAGENWGINLMQSQSGPKAMTNQAIDIPSAPKFHTGGWFGSGALKSGEVPLVGLEEEVALTKEQQRFYGKMFDAAANQGQPNIQVNVINNSGVPMNAEQGQPEFNGKDMIIGVVLEAAQKQGPMRDMLESFGKK